MIEQMAWSFFAYPQRYVDADESELATDDYPMQSLARAILKELG